MSGKAPDVEVIILGSGTSHGVPMIGCRCEVCTSDDPYDNRSRPSIFVKTGGLSVLIDTGPDLRSQCLANDIDRLDAVLFTHHHADHVTGLDDMRRFNWIMGGPVRLYGTERTLQNIERMFRYAFEHAPDSPHDRPQFELHTVDHEPFEIDGRRIVPIPLLHGKLPVLGFRFGDFAYCTDCSEIPDKSMALLRDLDVLVLEALRHTPHPAHFNLEQAIEAAKRIGAGRTYLTHIAHQISHAEVSRTLPDGIQLAHDGLRIIV
ncbi:MAG: MBL fold metallo-hydrolase [Phycisphaerae bacterium]|jgi:phosphoribosyl 1,2-cyclic phosphate phosphodiesterase